MKKTAIQYYLKWTAAQVCGVAFFGLCILWAGAFIDQATADYMAGGSFHAGDAALLVGVPFIIMPGVYFVAYMQALCIRWRAAK